MVALAQMRRSSYALHVTAGTLTRPVLVDFLQQMGCASHPESCKARQLTASALPGSLQVQDLILVRKVLDSDRGLLQLSLGRRRTCKVEGIREQLEQAQADIWPAEPGPQSAPQRHLEVSRLLALLLSMLLCMLLCLQAPLTKV